MPGFDPGESTYTINEQDIGENILRISHKYSTEESRCPQEKNQINEENNISHRVTGWDL